MKHKISHVHFIQVYERSTRVSLAAVSRLAPSATDADEGCHEA